MGASLSLSQQIRLSRCPCRSRPRSARAVLSSPLSSTSFSHCCSPSSSSSYASCPSPPPPPRRRPPPFPPSCLACCYSREIAATFSVLYTEGLGRRRGRYFHLESPARPPHTHMYTRAHGNTPSGGRERTRGRRGSVGQADGGREGGWRRGDGSYRTARHIGA